MDNKKSAGPQKKTTRKRTGEADGKGNKNPNLKMPSRTFAVWLIVAIVLVFGLKFLQDNGQAREQALTYTQFQALVAAPDAKIVKMDISLKGINRAVLRGEVTDPAVTAIYRLAVAEAVRSP